MIAEIAGAGWLNLTEDERAKLRFDIELLSVETGYTPETVRAAIDKLGAVRAAEILRLANEWGLSAYFVCQAIDMEV